jgi:molecular chaperone HscB
MDHFEVFGLPRRLGIDADALQRKFYELSRRSHPDFHQGAPAERQAEILATSAQLNAAYRALRDPIARVEYLVRLEEGRDTKEGATVKPKAPPELLEEMFEIQEALQEVKASERAGGPDAAARQALAAQRGRLLARYREEESRLRGPLSEAWDHAGADARAGMIAAFKEALAVRAYLRTVIDDIDEALGEVEEDHVSHRRH